MVATIKNVEKKVMNTNINIIIIGENILIQLMSFRQLRFIQNWHGGSMAKWLGLLI